LIHFYKRDIDVDKRKNDVTTMTMAM